MAKRASKPDMSAASLDTIKDDMKACVMIAAGPPRYGDTVEAMLWRAAQVLGITQRRARSFWERNPKRIEALEYLVIVERAKALQERRTNHAALEAQISALARQARDSGKRLGARANGQGHRNGDGE